VLQVCDGGTPMTVAQAPCADDTSVATLRLRCDGQRIQASWSRGDAAAEALGGPIDTRLVSVQAAGDGLHFTGAVVGPVAFSA